METLQVRDIVFSRLLFIEKDTRLTPPQIVCGIIADLKLKSSDNQDLLMEVVSAEAMLRQRPDNEGKVGNSLDAKFALVSFHKVFRHFIEQATNKEKILELVDEEEALFRNSREI